MSEVTKKPKRLQVGEFAKTVGKTVRALHLYEELGLLKPVDRSKGGFRLYDETSIERARWIVKLQGIGFTLAQIQVFVADFERAATGRVATSQARVVFTEKLAEVQSQLTKLRRSEADLVEALNYLDGCHNCASELSPASCKDCDQHGHTPDEVPHLFAGLSERAGSPLGAGPLAASPPAASPVPANSPIAIKPAPKEHEGHENAQSTESIRSEG